MPEIVILCGIPCSGKSSYANKLYKEDWSSNWRLICRDNIRENSLCFNQPYVFSNYNETIVTRVVDDMYSSDIFFKRDIIIDNTHCKEAYLNAEIKRKPEGYTLRIIFFDCPLWKAYYRNVVRYIMTGKWIPFEVIRNMKKNYDKIDKKKYEKVF